jgi:hypothetical protein
MKVRLAVTTLLASLCAAAVTPATASGQTGFVKTLYVRDSDGLIFVDLFGWVDYGDYSPACPRAHSHWIVPDETTDSGQRLFATLLEALVTGHKIRIQGRHTCNRTSEGEDIESVEVR